MVCFAHSRALLAPRGFPIGEAIKDEEQLQLFEDAV